MTTPPPAQPGSPTPPGNPTPKSDSTLDDLATAAKRAAQKAKEGVAKVTRENKAKIDGALDKAGATVDQKTGGKYAKQIASVKEKVERGVEIVAGAGTPPAPPAAPAPSAGTTQTTPPAPPAPPAPSAEPAPPKEGWHRGPDGRWVRTGE